MARPTQSPHDAIAKRFYRDPRMVADLLRGFLPNDLVAQLDLATLDELPASYVGRDFQRRHGDTLWRLRLRDGADRAGEWLYVLVLLEFQSGIDRFMALRILTYTGLAYEALLQRGDIKADGPLPPVLPFVVHGGATPWSAPLDVSDLIARVDAPLARFQPSNRYALLDEIGTTTDDLPSDNLAAAQIVLKHHAPRAGAVARWLAQRLQGPEDEELRRTFTQWIAYWATRDDAPSESIEAWRQLADSGALQTMANMFDREWAELAEKHRGEGRAEGFELGREQGVEQGIEQEMQRQRALLSRQAARKFDAETAARLSELLQRVSDPDRFVDVGDAIIECATGAALLARAGRIASDD